MTQPRAHARDLRRVIHGSNRAHETLADAVLRYLALVNVPAIPVHTGPRVRPREGGGFELRANARQHGLADIVACLPPNGRLALLELKTGRASRSPEQIKLHERFTAAGALCIVVRSVTELEPYLGGILRHRFTSGGNR